MSELILHVGPHKTGSTAIQKALHDKRSQIASFGVVYPREGIRDFGHHEIVNAGRNWKSSFDPALLRQEVDGSSICVISSENFVHLDEAALRRVKEMLPMRPNRIVYYLRRIPDLWASHRQELMKHGMSVSVGDYLAAAAGPFPLGENIVIDQHAQLSRLASVFGRETLSIVGYDALRDEKADLGEHFRKTFIPIVDLDLSTKKEVNASKDVWQTELLRVMNQIHQEITGCSATLKLRIAVFSDLHSEKIDFVSEFRDAVDRFSTMIAVSNRHPTVVQMQKKLLSDFRDRLIGDPEKAEEAYIREKETRFVDFRPPVVGFQSLRSRLLGYYESLPTEAKEAI